MKFASTLLLVALAEGSVYLHSPRGSNNRLNEQSAQNANDERLFYSKNNRRGGYNVGDKTNNAFSDEAGQYAMKYFQSGPDGSGGDSILTVEWTNLVGCGYDEDGDKIHNCEVVIQSYCQSDETVGIPPSDSFTIRNGIKTDKMDYELDPDNLFDPQGRCYIDSRNRDLSHRAPNIPNNAADSIQYCLDSCKERGYLYAATQYTFECFCDNEFGKYGEAPLDECNRNCRDGSGRKCGGSWRQNVYLADSTAPAAKQSEASKFAPDVDINDPTYNADDMNQHKDDDQVDQYLVDKIVQQYLDSTTDKETNTSNEKEEQEEDEKINPSTQSDDEEDCGIFQALFNTFLSKSGSKRRALRQATQQEKNQRRAASTDRDIGLHEPWEFYDRCDDEMGTRYGMECLQERDTWPYESITPWVDVAYFSDNSENACTDQITTLNQKQYFECVEYYDAAKQNRRHKSQYTNDAECIDNGGDWLGFYKVGDILNDIANAADCQVLNQNSGSKTYVWGRPMSWKDLAADILSAETCIALPDDVECLQAPNTRDGYLGGVDEGRETPRFIWTLPNYEEDKRCVMRLRYIVSSNEEEISRSNNIVYTDGTDGITIAPAPARVTFEDRSHIFKLLQRPSEVSDSLTIHNLVVRGKRGNIVQTYPAVEYDFVPNRLTITEGDAIHVQWAGSNTHNNGRPGGDGQTGDAGEGRAGTDRNNFVQLLNRKSNFPAPFHNQTLFHNADWIWSSHEKGDPDDAAFNLAVSMATSGYYNCANSNECSKEYDNSLDNKLNEADASFFGNIFAPAVGEYHYKCMRNDNFSNRAQKGTITVVEA
jgi:plastocyanin